MRARRHVTAAALLMLAPGCSIHPVPEDVTHVTTYHIVRQIRCETRQALIDFVKRQLGRQATGPEHDAIANKLLLRYEREPESIKNFQPGEFAGPDYAPYRRFYNIILSAAIAYNFDLTMTEDNNLTTGIDLVGPWKSKLTLGITGDANRQRSNQRTFTVTDTFQELLAYGNPQAPDTGEYYCDNQLVAPNHLYPIAGEIGVAKTVRTFFELTMLANLAADKAKPGQEGAPTMVDNLKFTTMIDLSGTPKVVFAPIGSGFQLADVSLTGLVKRTDVHQVMVGLALEPKGMTDLGLLRNQLFAGTSGTGRAAAQGMTSSLYVGNRIIGAGGGAAKLATAAIDKVKTGEVKLIPSP
ncbi:MAG: hypothetical protein EKK33_02690 [Bradyrhizobiaceae bacterium]|nr:MAG: hypothetical protein EKK33_02690 [Bradyrhizobiaceae bacterium]